MNKTILIKVSLFSVICSLLFILAAYLTQIELIYILSVVSGVVCVGSLLAYVCSLIFKKFKYSVNVISIIIFVVIAITGKILDPTKISTDTFRELTEMEPMTFVWTGSTIAAFICVIVLVGRVIFSNNKYTNETNHTNTPGNGMYMN